MEEDVLAPVFSALAILGFGVTGLFLLFVLRNYRKKAISPLILAGAILLPFGSFPRTAEAVLGAEQVNEYVVRMTPFLDHASEEGSFFATNGIQVSPRYFEIIYYYPGYVSSLSMLLVSWGFYLRIKSRISRHLTPNQTD